MTADNSDLFLTVDVQEEPGTLEQRWGPAGYLCCSCGDYHVCNKKAAWGVIRCKKCGEQYIWVEKNNLEAANPWIIEERKAILSDTDIRGHSGNNRSASRDDELHDG